MRYQTKMMRAILTNEKAQEMIDYISTRLYGESYAGLWMFQAIGAVMDEVYKIAEALRYETNPATADILLDYWEDHYALPRNRSLTKEQRQSRIVAQAQMRGPCNPTVLANAVSAALGGAPVEITENIAKNTFLVNVRMAVPDLDPAKSVLERIKPAHLIYKIQVSSQLTEIDAKMAVAVTHAEHYKIEVN